jgi:hypothetical protein
MIKCEQVKNENYDIPGSIINNFAKQEIRH